MLIPVLREKARANGYAIGVHGSLERDIDLIAVPWAEPATDSDYLASELFAVVEAVFKPATMHPGSTMPHGRRAWLFQFCGVHFIDLSVMPRLEKREESSD
jgi:hypothetical protein